MWIYGHSHEHCSIGKPKEVQSPEEVIGDAQSEGGNSKGKNHMEKGTIKFRPEITDSFGPWMIVK